MTFTRARLWAGRLRFLHAQLAAAILVFSAFMPAPLHAHESLPIVVLIDEPASGEFVIGLRMPANVDPGQHPVMTLALPCRNGLQAANAAIIRCPQSYRPGSVAVAWPRGAPSSAILVRAHFRDGEQHSRVFAPGSRQLDLPRAETPARVVASYVRIGTEHILLGFDHLLFLTCLVLIAGTLRRVALTVTGFTLGHALTISLASLGIVHVDNRLVEALIALSIVFVATELARGRDDTLTMRYPVLVAAGFGTLHGLGFAGALAEISLAQTAVALSLVGFNLGVEAGQLIFVLAVLGAIAAGRRLGSGLQAVDGLRLRHAAVAGIGILSSVWFWQRTLSLV